MVPVSFPNTIAYPPILYLPQTVGWTIGEAAGLTILRTEWLARMCQALVAIALGCIAIQVFPPTGRPLLMAILLLPTLLNLNATASQDSLITGIAALEVAIAARALQQHRHLRHSELAVSALLILLTATARPPYLMLLVLLFLPGMNLRPVRLGTLAAPALLAAVVMGLTAAWQVAVHPIPPFVLPGADPAAQSAFLHQHLLLGAAHLLTGTIKRMPNLMALSFESLGLGDVVAPRLIYIALALGGLLLLLTAPVGARLARYSQLLLVTALVVAVAGISAAMYLTASDVGSAAVGGLQSRYYLPMFPAAILLIPGWAGLQEHTVVLLRRAGAALFLGAVVYTPWVAAHEFYRMGLWTTLQTLMK